MRLGETPVPIPNTMVKPYSADGTALATVWESRWLPDFYEEKAVVAKQLTRFANEFGDCGSAKSKARCTEQSVFS